MLLLKPTRGSKVVTFEKSPKLLWRRLTKFRSLLIIWRLPEDRALLKVDQETEYCVRKLEPEPVELQRVASRGTNTLSRTQEKGTNI